MSDLDAIDRRMLALLVEDGRATVPELAAGAKISRATGYSRFERLRMSGVVRGVHADVDPAALGYGLSALVLLNVQQGSWERTREEIADLPGVEWVALTGGSFDFVMLVRAPDMHALRDVVLVSLHRMRSVRSTQTMFILDEHRRCLGPVEAVGKKSPRASTR